MTRAISHPTTVLRHLDEGYELLNQSNGLIVLFKPYNRDQREATGKRGESLPVSSRCLNTMIQQRIIRPDMERNRMEDPNEDHHPIYFQKVQ